MKFTINEHYLTSITVKKYHSKNVFDILKDDCYSLSSEDHPEFTKLREMLEAQGYISIERRWWNGDIVLKKFYLNGKLFKKNDKFQCASAMKFRLK